MLTRVCSELKIQRGSLDKTLCAAFLSLENTSLNQEGHLVENLSAKLWRPLTRSAKRGTTVYSKTFGGEQMDYVSIKILAFIYPWKKNL